MGAALASPPEFCSILLCSDGEQKRTQGLSPEFLMPPRQSQCVLCMGELFPRTAEAALLRLPPAHAGTLLGVVGKPRT